MTTASEDLRQMIADIDERLGSNQIPHVVDDHRRTVDLYRALRKVTSLQRDLETSLSMTLTGSITSYIDKAASE